MHEDIQQSSPTPIEKEELILNGVAASPGIVIAPVAVFRKDKIIVQKKKIKKDDIPQELERLAEGILKTQQQIREIKKSFAETLSEDDMAILDVHILVVGDVAIIDEVKRKLHERLLSVEYIYQGVIQSYIAQMKKLNDPYFRERSQDVLDVGHRVINNLKATGQKKISFDTPSILLSNDLTFSDILSFDRSSILSLAVEGLSQTCHATIVARSLNIPSVVGLKTALSKAENGDPALLDGYSGKLIFFPTPETLYKYGISQKEHEVIEESLKDLQKKRGQTKDGKLITLSANVEVEDDLEYLEKNGAEGVGLYRTEFLFLNREEHPSEDEQVEAYRKVAQACKPHSLIVRTLDVGGDKFSRSFNTQNEEKNPFLGWRGIRVCLDMPDLFKTQLRAIYRTARDEGNVRIMFPMISNLSELREAKRLLNEARDELRERGIDVPDSIECGMMVEVPSAALMAEVFAKEVDFFSIGSNDLIQYTLAVDRMNEKIANLYKPTHPAMLFLLKKIVQAAHQNDIWVGVCGEMASNINLVPLFVGLGVDELSMGSGSLPRIKKAISNLNHQEMKDMIPSLLKLNMAENILKKLQEIGEKTYPDLLK